MTFAFLRSGEDRRVRPFRIVRRHVFVVGLLSLITTGSSSAAPPTCNAGPDVELGCFGNFTPTPVASDPDGDPLTYRWESDCTGIVFVPDRTLLQPEIYLGPRCDGDCTLTLTVSDDEGSASDSLTIARGDREPPAIFGLAAEATLPCGSEPAPALSCGPGAMHHVSGSVTADNAYQIYSGDESGATLTEHGAECATLAQQISRCEEYDFVTEDCFLYLTAWSDARVSQGLIHDLFLDGSPMWSDASNWELYPANRTIGRCPNAPTRTQVADAIAEANATDGWTAPTVGPPNDGTFFGVLRCIEPPARWTWHDTGVTSGPLVPFQPGANHDEFLIFRARLTNLTVVDDCDPSPTVTVEHEPLPGDCPGAGQVLVRYTATDSCGHVGTAEQLIDLVDVEPPTLLGVPEDTLVSCMEALEPTRVRAIDGCDPIPLVEMTEVVLAGDCSTDCLLERTWTATDCSGNVSTATQLVTFSQAGGFDDLAPDLRCPLLLSVEPSDIDGAVVAPQATVTDDCDPDPDAANDRTGPGLDATDQYPCGRTVVTFSASDAAGNRSECPTIVQVMNESLPRAAAWSTGLPLLVRREGPTQLSVDLPLRRQPAERFGLYRGTIASLQAGIYDHVGERCGELPTDIGDGYQAFTIDSLTESHYFLVSASNCLGESDLGTSSFGARRPAGATSCGAVP
ncbi:MAG: hypothetical protein AAF533_21060 [Acidobacteriota bacterium]